MIQIKRFILPQYWTKMSVCVKNHPICLYQVFFSSSAPFYINSTNFQLFKFYSNRTNCFIFLFVCLLSSFFAIQFPLFHALFSVLPRCVRLNFPLVRYRSQAQPQIRLRSNGFGGISSIYPLFPNFVIASGICVSEKENKINSQNKCF